MDEGNDRCCAKVGEPFRMRECGLPIEFVSAGAVVYGVAVATYTGFYHLDAGQSHHAVSSRWTR